MMVPVGLEDVEKPCMFLQTGPEALNVCRSSRVLRTLQGLGDVSSRSVLPADAGPPWSIVRLETQWTHSIFTSIFKLILEKMIFAIFLNLSPLFFHPICCLLKT